ncbi:unnamed protein product [Strongylus vulgaris]|uniref:Reverse transcriptase domain-containing protein n=1 Tax=Strongylus vulgaris TaxID=40348 RepID=A0A3P7JNB4_STRVU|nr:unnamed protein product [Strongylus vulgaris]
MGGSKGDTVWPKLFTAALVVHQISGLERGGIQVDGRFLSNLHFVEDIVLSKNITEAEMGLKEVKK